VLTKVALLWLTAWVNDSSRLANRLRPRLTLLSVLALPPPVWRWESFDSTEAVVIAWLTPEIAVVDIILPTMLVVRHISTRATRSLDSVGARWHKTCFSLL
jgi:hypothetical protein